MAALKITKDITNKKLIVERVFQAPLPKVWAAWTDADKLEKWWGPKEWPAKSKSFDFREGGHWHFFMKGPDGTEVWVWLDYLTIREGTSLKTADYFCDSRGTKASGNPTSVWDVSFQTLTEQSSKVTTTLSFSTEADLSRVVQMGFETGYASALENLDDLLAGTSRGLSVRSKDGTEIVYDKIGTGPAVILVSGAMVTRDFSGNTDLAKELADRHTVYNYDRRGRGQSSDTEPYAIEREIEDLAALIEVAGGAAQVYGMSSGAVLALHAAAHGLKITRLALYEPPFVVKETDRRPPLDSLQVVTKMISENRRAAAVTYFMTKVFGMPYFIALLMRLTPYWQSSLAVAKTLPYDLAIVGDFNLPAKTVASVKVPALVLYGEKTQRLLVNAATVLVTALPQGQLRSLSGQSHNVSIQVLAPILREFFST